MVRILALLLFVLSGPLLAEESAGSLFEYGGVKRDYGADLVANYRNGAFTIAVRGKEIHPGQVDGNGIVVVSDNRILQFSVMQAGLKSGRVISEADSRKILEMHRQSRVSYLKTLTDKPALSEPGQFKTIEGRNIYFWHLDTAPAPTNKKDNPNTVWRHLHATTMAGDMVVILIVPLTPLDDENVTRDWLEKTVATLTVHDKPFVRN